MKLFDLISFKHSLEANLDTTELRVALEKLCQHVNNIKHQAILEPDNVEYVDKIIEYYQNLIPSLEAPLELKKAKIKEIENIITEQSHDLFAKSYDIEIHNGGVDNVRHNRRIKMQEDTEQIVKQRIMLHTNWRYPALEIGCRDGEWTPYLVAADPLYVMDQFDEFLTNTSQQFPAAYQARLRKYTINRETHDLSALPKGQLAFVFSWGYFNYISLDTFTQVVAQLRDLMRPGGVFLFSYNDGDTANGIGLAENHGQSYLPKSLVVPTCLAQGFEVLAEYHPEPNVHWLEIRKPGVLHTVKAHQVLGEIIRQEFAEMH